MKFRCKFIILLKILTSLKIDSRAILPNHIVTVSILHHTTHCHVLVEIEISTWEVLRCRPIVANHHIHVEDGMMTTCEWDKPGWICKVYIQP